MKPQYMIYFTFVNKMQCKYTLCDLIVYANYIYKFKIKKMYNNRTYL